MSHTWAKRARGSSGLLMRFLPSLEVVCPWYSRSAVQQNTLTHLLWRQVLPPLLPEPLTFPAILRSYLIPSPVVLRSAAKPRTPTTPYTPATPPAQVYTLHSVLLSLLWGVGRHNLGAFRGAEPAGLACPSVLFTGPYEVSTSGAFAGAVARALFAMPLEPKPDMSTTPPRPRSALPLQGFVFSRVNRCTRTTAPSAPALPPSWPPTTWCSPATRCWGRTSGTAGGCCGSTG